MSNLVPMKTARLTLNRLHRVLVLIVCCWLGLGPFAASATFSEPDLECCCGGGSACLLFGCECGGHEPPGDSENGDIRSAPCQTDDTAASFFGRHLGLALGEPTPSTVEPIGRAACDIDSLPDFPSCNPDSPPPRCTDAFQA